MNNSYSIKFEKRKSELYLAISCLIKKNKEIMDIQDNLWKELRNIDDVDFVEDINTLNQKNNKKIVYKYPIDRIHFSLFVILTLNIDSLNFEEECELFKKEKTFKEIGNIIAKVIDEEILANHKFLKSGKVKRIYFPSKQKIENSIALNIFTENLEFLENLELNIKNRLKKYYPEEGIKLKIRDKEYFVINLIRFINNDDSNDIKESSIYEKIEKINKELEEKPIKADFDIEFVISDPYLSNKNPFLE